MPVLTLTGTLLVVFSWLFLLAVIYSLGLIPTRILHSDSGRNRALPRHSLWWGFALLFLLVLILGLFFPLTSVWPLIIVLIVVSFSAVITRVLWRQVGPSGFALNRLTLVLLAVFGAVTFVIALRALGPANNYDTGLYHLGVIKYFSDYSTIPGLANVLNAFGYNNGQFPLAAFLGNGPWQGIGFRLLNGLVMVLVMLDAVIRVGTRKWSLGTFVILVGIPILFLPLVAITDFWVTSPTSDTPIMLLSLIATAYLADFVTGRTLRTADLSVVIVVLSLLIALRPTMLVFAGMSLVVVVLALWRKYSTIFESGSFRGALIRVGVLSGSFTLTLGLVQLVRDYFLSGWFLYPLSFFHFNVDWLAADPTSLRDATLANARDPAAESHFETAHSWSWIPQWFADRWSMWETYLLILGLVFALLLWLVTRRRGFSVNVKLLSILWVPSVASVAFWFLLSPPSYRFIWGPLFLLFIIPIAQILWQWKKSRVRENALGVPIQWSVVGVIGLILIPLTLFTAISRVDYPEISQERNWVLGPISIPYAVAPAPAVPVIEFGTQSGLIMTSPTQSDQCWENYPLCTYPPNAFIELRGNSLGEGFRLSEAGN